jgi:type II secretory pathway component PulF
MTSLENFEPELAEALEMLAEADDEPVLSLIHEVEESLGEGFRLSEMNERRQIMMGNVIRSIVESLDEGEELEDAIGELL